MSMSSLRASMFAAVLGGLGAASAADPSSLLRKRAKPPAEPAGAPRFRFAKEKTRGARSNEKRRPSRRALKKHKRAIAYASKRRNRT
jgi:hypothetical protein